MGKRLLYSLSTRRTLRTHDNIVANTFTFQEQLCGLENLRLWSDDEGDGSVLAMIQYSSNFREGILQFLPPFRSPADRQRLFGVSPRRAIHQCTGKGRGRKVGEDQRSKCKL